MAYVVARQIEIDAGHRIPDHGSKCFAIHGHRYKIELGIFSTKLQSGGQETGMIKDFSFLKEVLVKHVHGPCDHRLMLCIDDPFTKFLLSGVALKLIKSKFDYIHHPTMIPTVTKEPMLPITVCSFTPTAENLAEAWYWAMAEDVKTAILHLPDYVTVWETPNCAATYMNENTQVGGVQ